jgi:hypothetical protein
MDIMRITWGRLLALGFAWSAATAVTQSQDRTVRRPSLPPPPWTVKSDAGKSAARSQPEAARVAVIELDWLADPLTFPYSLEAVRDRSRIEVRGVVPNQQVREQALQIARSHTSLPLRDALKEDPKLRVRTERRSRTELQEAVAQTLHEAFPRRQSVLAIVCSAEGIVTIQGLVPSLEQKLALSRALQRLPGCACVVNLTEIHELAPVAAQGAAPRLSAVALVKEPVARELPPLEPEPWFRMEPERLPNLELASEESSAPPVSNPARNPVPRTVPPPERPREQTSAPPVGLPVSPRVHLTGSTQAEPVASVPLPKPPQSPLMVSLTLTDVQRAPKTAAAAAPALVSPTQGVVFMEDMEERMPTTPPLVVPAFVVKNPPALDPPAVTPALTVSIAQRTQPALPRLPLPDALSVPPVLLPKTPVRALAPAPAGNLPADAEAVTRRLTGRLREACPQARRVTVTVVAANEINVDLEVRPTDDCGSLAAQILAIPDLEGYRVTDLTFHVPQE